MYNILLYGSVLVLAFVCVLVVLFVLMQRPSANSGMGSALGGATTESVFGGETANVLSKATAIFIALFFLLCAGLYFAFVAKKSDAGETGSLKLETSSAPAAPIVSGAPAETPVAPAKSSGAPAESPWSRGVEK